MEVNNCSAALVSKWTSRLRLLAAVVVFCEHRLLTAAASVVINATDSTQSVQPVPLISVSLHDDQRDYLPRLLRSIDYVVNRVIIQIGNEDAVLDQCRVEFKPHER